MMKVEVYPSMLFFFLGGLAGQFSLVRKPGVMCVCDSP